MEEQSFRSQRSDQVLGEGKRVSGPRKTSLTPRAVPSGDRGEVPGLPRVCHPRLAGGCSSGSRASSTECVMPRVRSRELRDRINHTDKVLLSDKL